MDQLEHIGRYQLLARLATGGMAEIFLARQTGIGGFEKLVVVKRILPQLAREQAFVEMFLDEAVIAAQLNHPNVVQIYDLGESERSYYIAMEYLEGESLGHLVSEGVRQGQPLGPGLAANLIAQVCDGLHYAHTLEDEQGRPLGIVHRDISPHNVIVLFSGTAKLVDFGIAKAATKVHQTQVGTLKGKLTYMSPEQCLGKTVDSRSDLFSLGVVLWELLARKRLFKRDAEPAIIRAIVDEPIPEVRQVRDDVPQALAAVVERALQKEPGARFASAAEMAAALRDFMHQADQDASPQAVEGYALAVLGDQSRTKKRLLEQIRRGGAAATPARQLKPKSDSIPSRARAESAAQLAAMAEAATRIRTEDEDLAVPPAAGGVRWLRPLLIGLLLCAAGGLGLWWLFGQPATGPQAPAAVEPPPADEPPPAPQPEPALQSEPEPDDQSEPEPAPRPRPDPARLAVRSTPEGCTVQLDGRALEPPTPIDELEVEPDVEHRVTVRCADHQPSEQRFAARPGERVSLAFAPAPAAAPPRQRPQAEARGGKQNRPKSRPKPKPETRSRSRPEPRPAPARAAAGKLNLNTKPWSEVSLGGRKLGITPLLGIELPAGQHDLLCVNPGRGISKTIRVTIEPGETTSLSLKLP
jgi:serine/threonine-protein kinase